MAVFIEKLKELVEVNANKSDQIKIISGYATPDTIDYFAKSGNKIEFIYGMYPTDGITEKTLAKLREIDTANNTLDVRIAIDYHVHTKCYLFYSKGKIINALVGSANCSYAGLESKKNCEMLVELNTNELKNDSYLKRLQVYYDEVKSASLSCQDGSIVSKNVQVNKKKTKKGHIPLTGNPRVMLLPLYTFSNGKKIVKKASGLNWGLQKGKSRKSGYVEAYFPITAEIIDNYPSMIPSFPLARTNNAGKSTRRYDTITVLWDDLTVMEMLFQGNGVERPTKSRPQGTPFFAYPKNLSSDDGGAKLGEYLRKRMNIAPRKMITMADLKRYGRDTIQLSYISPNYYEADFSV